MTKDIDAAMNSMPPGWKSRWCNSHMCACMGCANKAGGLTAKGYTYEDWRDWISRNNEDYVNGLSPTKPLIIPHGQEKKMNDSLETKNWKIQMKNAAYPMLEMVDDDTVKINGVEYKKVEKPKPPTLFKELSRKLTESYITDDDMYEICEIVEEWLPNRFQYPYQEYGEGWNDCLDEIKENLR